MNSDTKNAFTGMLLIVAILFGWNLFTAPSAAELAEKKRTADAAVFAAQRQDSLARVATIPTTTPSVNDSIAKMQKAAQLGDFAKLSIGYEQLSIVENDNIKITFSNKGGRIKNVLLKKFKRLIETPERKDQYLPLFLLEDMKNKFEIILPTNTASGNVSTEDLFFQPSVVGNTVTFRAAVNETLALEQTYTLGTGYDLDYNVKFNGVQSILRNDAQNVQFHLDNYIDKVEKNISYERNYSYLQYHEKGGSRDYLSTSSNEAKTLKTVEWITNSNQFFNTTLIATQSPFTTANVSTEVYDDKAEDLKRMTTKIDIPVQQLASGYKMSMYIGPNDYDILHKYGNKMEEIVDYGGSILGTINRYIIRPLFDFLHSIVGNVAICILLLTFVVKALLYPLSFGMLKSQAKTASLKPEIDKMKAKYKDDSQKIQMEQMKMYQEYGVNPLGGCLPTLLQMPIWMALFRFFPATIDFRQQGFLWANDLSGFEEFVKLPFHIPLYGAHISLFALLWGASLIFFTVYSMKDTDMTGQPAGMKQLQYFSPVLFTVMFNSYAAGLSLYMLFSNLLNIAQTIITKKYVINHADIREKLEQNKKNPKKKSAFRERLDTMVKEQQEVQKQKDGKKK